MQRSTGRSRLTAPALNHAIAEINAFCFQRQGLAVPHAGSRDPIRDGFDLRPESMVFDILHTGWPMTLQGGLNIVLNFLFGLIRK